MADHPHGMKAETGTVELHHEPSAFGITAPGFVAIAMLVVVGIILWKRVPAMIGKMLDAKIDSIHWVRERCLGDKCYRWIESVV